MSRLSHIDFWRCFQIGVFVVLGAPAPVRSTTGGSEGVVLSSSTCMDSLSLASRFLSSSLAIEDGLLPDL